MTIQHKLPDSYRNGAAPILLCWTAGRFVQTAKPPGSVAQERVCVLGALPHLRLNSAGCLVSTTDQVYRLEIQA